MKDVAGKTATIGSSVFGSVPGVYEAHAPESPNSCSTSAAFRTLRIPLESFTANGTFGLDLSAVNSVTVRLGSALGTPAARLAIDDLEVEP